LAQLEKEKHDPLALLLMRDRRPGAAAASEVKEDPALARLRNLNLIEKKEVVFEEPGAEKGFFSRVADKLNPFSSSDNGKKDEKKEESAEELLAKTKATPKEESSGLLSSLWPFGSKDSKPASRAAPNDGKSSALVSKIDDSLAQKGIDSTTRQAALKPPAADLPNTDDLAKPPPAKTDTAALLTAIDSDLKKSGKNAAELPPTPEIAEGFKNPAAAQTRVAKPVSSDSSRDIQNSGILASIDQKLKAKGVEPAQFEQPSTAVDEKVASMQKPQTRNVEIEPRLTLEKGPLFLSPSDVPAQASPAASAATQKPDAAGHAEEPPSRVLVKGPLQSAAAPTRPAETKKPHSIQEDESKGVFDQIRQDMENVSKALNPFSW
jgi:hypothetical protein